MIIKKLKSLKDKKILATFERLDLTSTELSGYVVYVNDEIVVIQEYSDNGYFNGYSMFEISQINEVYWGNRAHKSIQKLIENEAETIVVFPKDVELLDFEDSLKILSYHFDYFEFYCENFSESNFSIGKILEYDIDWLSLDCLGNKGTVSKIKKLMRRIDITKVNFATPYISKIKSLHKTK